MLVVGIDSARPQGFIEEPMLPLAGNAPPTEEAYVPTIDRPPARDRPAVSRGADDRPALEGSWNHGMRLSSPDEDQGRRLIHLGVAGRSTACRCCRKNSTR